MQRELRVDFLRGTALLIILWDHVFRFTGESMPFFLQITPVYWGVTSAAEGFVFLSGYVYGLVYAAFFERHGFWATYAKSLNRAWQLYIAAILTMIVILAIVSWWRTSGAGLSDEVSQLLLLPPFMSPTPDLYWDIATLRIIPWGIEVLGLYIVLLISAPMYLALLRQHPVLPFVVALILYAIVQLHVPIPFDRFGTSRWYFNPFAWQLLFLLGIAGGGSRLTLPRDGWVRRVAASTVGIVAIHLWVLPKLVDWSTRLEVSTGVGIVSQLTELSNLSYPLQGVRNLEPVRLAYFCIFAFVIAVVTSPTSEFWGSRAAKPILRLGQTSLEAYCFGVVFTYAAVAIRPSLPTGWPVTVLVALFGFLLSVVFAGLLQKKQKLAATAARRGDAVAPLAPMTP